jgi:hypothetical protein
MNKKQLMALVMSLVERVQEHDEGLSEGEARTLVGISLRHHSDSIVAKCMGIVEPDWSDYRSEAKTVADLEDEAAAIYAPETSV